MITKKQFSKFLLRYTKNKESILDVGCGDCKVLYYMLLSNKKITGIDVEFKNSKEYDYCKNVLKKIDVDSRENQSNIRFWPVETATIDFLYTRTVLEHVPDLGVFLDELKRVTKKGTNSIHYFPAYYQLLECHTGVPLGSFIRIKPWYLLMCVLRLCKKDYVGFIGGIKAHNYIKKYTFYRKSSYIRMECEKRGLIYKDITEKFLFEINHFSTKIISKSKFLVFLFSKVRSNCVVIEKP